MNVRTAERGFELPPPLLDLYAQRVRFVMRNMECYLCLWGAFFICFCVA